MHQFQDSRNTLKDSTHRQSLEYSESFNYELQNSIDEETNQPYSRYTLNDISLTESNSNHPMNNQNGILRDSSNSCQSILPQRHTESAANVELNSRNTYSPPPNPNKYQLSEMENESHISALKQQESFLDGVNEEFIGPDGMFDSEGILFSFSFNSFRSVGLGLVRFSHFVQRAKIVNE